MAGVLRIADAQAWVDAHGGSLTPDALAGELLTRFPLLAPQDYAGLLERASLGSEATGAQPRDGGEPPSLAADRVLADASHTLPFNAAVIRARELIIFCDGLEEAGEWDRYIGRARAAARDVIDLAEVAEAERSARVAAFEERDRWRAVALSYSRRAQEEDDEEPGPE